MCATNALAQFTDRAEEVGVYNKYTATTYIGGGVGLIDVNNDNLLDIYLTGGINPDRLYMNTGNGFEREVLYVGPEDFDFLNYETIGVAVGDVNNDGYDDLYVSTARSYPSLLMINKGDSSFDILTPGESGIQEADWAVSTCFGDINKDGLLDIFATNYVDTIRSSIDSFGNSVFEHVGFNNYLYINQGSNSFEEMGADYGVQLNSTTLSATFTDYDNDSDADLYVINDFGHHIIPNELYHNHYPAMQFEDRSVASAANVAIFGMGVAVGDHDGDLDLDYYITNIGRNVLISNNGDGTFTEMAYQAGVQDSVNSSGERLVGWGTGFFDYNNDGWPDLYVSNGHIPAAADILNPQYNVNSLYRNNGDGTFTEEARNLGLADPSANRGSAFGDLNNDGSQDLIFVPVSTNPNFVPPELNSVVALYYNETENDHHYVKVKLRGVISNKNGYGAHLYLHDNTGHVQLREADGGSGHASSNSPFVHFGLGNADQIDSLVIQWPSGIRQVVIGPEVDQLHIITESEGTVISGQADNMNLEMDVFPNPFIDFISVQMPESKMTGQMTYQFHSIDGRLVDKKLINSNIFDVPTTSIPSGTYVLSIYHGDRMIGMRQLVKD